jgi:carboxymethylenebutenolidase
MGKFVQLQAGDGFELDAYVAQPVGEARGGVVVVQEIFGVNEHIRSVADRFAQEGFFAVAPAIFDRVEKHVDLGFDGPSMQKGMGIAQKLSIDDAVKDVDAALQYAGKETGKPAAVVGYCYGGTLAWLSATRLKPAAAVGYYGGYIANFAGETPKAPVMLHFGLHDDHIPQTDVDKVRVAHPEVEIFLYDTGHAFNNDMRASYNEKAAREAMSRTLEFLSKHA